MCESPERRESIEWVALHAQSEPNVFTLRSMLPGLASPDLASDALLAAFLVAVPAETP